MKKKLLAGLVIALLARAAMAFEPFPIKDIRVVATIKDGRTIHCADMRKKFCKQK